MAITNLRERTVVRFGATLVATVFRVGVSFLSGLVVARGLGSAGFGDLNFLLGSFTAVNLILDMGTSTAYYTFVAQRRRRTAFFLVYLIWTLGIQFVGTVCVLWLILPEGALLRAWPGQSRGLVLLAFGVTFMTTQMWTMVSQLGEALRQTIVVQIFAATQASAHFVLVVVARYSGWLTIRSVMWLLILEYVVLASFLAFRFLPRAVENVNDREPVWSIVRAFVRYCRPLMLYGWVGFCYHFADRWFLQNFAGSREQGFFSISQQFSAISLFATASIINVFWKEMAEARERNDQQRQKQLYTVVRRGLYFVAAWTSCLLIPYSSEIVRWLLGSDYSGASLAMAIMFLYPIHQSLGQIQSTVFYATGQTSLYSKIGIVNMLISIPVSYFLLAPRTQSIPGLHLGAAGLASKMVVLQMLGVCLLAYQLKRLYGWSEDNFYQGTVLLAFLGLGLVGRLLATRMFQVVLPPGGLATVISGVCFYIAGSSALLYFRPTLIGIDPRALRRWLDDRPWRSGSLLLTLSGR
jgi:O-antigen/teichoic acid export membrane protein